VGAAGASCVDLYAFPWYSNDFICELFPDTGAIATQAYHLALNQLNAATRMRAGDSPTQLIAWLQANDIGFTPQSNYTHRQYGVVRMGGGYPQAAAFTGTSCMNYKDHRIGPNYTIHGNILLGAQVLDSMEARFLRAKGDLACKLMEAMQGANMVGADSRCAPNGSSSLFAFLKVSLPTDTFGKPSFLISLKTPNGAGVEPIDSLQVMFDYARTCTVNTNPVSIKRHKAAQGFKVFPNPASQNIVIRPNGAYQETKVEVRDVSGRLIYSGKFSSETSISVKNWASGLYYVSLSSATHFESRKVWVDAEKGNLREEN